MGYESGYKSGYESDNDVHFRRYYTELERTMNLLSDSHPYLFKCGWSLKLELESAGNVYFQAGMSDGDDNDTAEAKMNMVRSVPKLCSSGLKTMQELSEALETIVASGVLTLSRSEEKNVEYHIAGIDEVTKEYPAINPRDVLPEEDALWLKHIVRLSYEYGALSIPFQKHIARDGNIRDEDHILRISFGGNWHSEFVDVDIVTRILSLYQEFLSRIEPDVSHRYDLSEAENDMIIKYYFSVNGVHNVD